MHVHLRGNRTSVDYDSMTHWQPDITFGQFKRLLKTFMFGQLGRGALCLNVKGAD